MEQEAIVSFQPQDKSTVHAHPGLFGALPTVAIALWALARSSEPWVSLLLLPPWWFLRCFLLLRSSLWLLARGFRGVGRALPTLRLAPLPLQLPPLALLCGGLLRDAAVKEGAERARHVGLRRGCRPVLEPLAPPRNLHAAVPRKQSHLLLELRLAPASEVLRELAVGGHRPQGCACVRKLSDIALLAPPTTKPSPTS